MAERYQALQQHEFRVLRLLTTQESISAQLEVLNLDHMPQYLALSYTWQPSRGGNWHDSRRLPRIVLHGEEVRIQTNLYDALAELRPTILEADIPIFIDALCIDQSNDNEKSMQVTEMHQIYARAKEVIAWIGVPMSDHEADLAAQLLRSCGRIYDLTSTNTTNHFLPVLGSECYRKWIALIDLLEEEYWQRTWILQEITAPARTRFWYGRHHFTRNDLFQALEVAQRVAPGQVLEEPLDRVLGTKSTVHRLQSLTGRRQHGVPELWSLCRLTRHTRCSDPRDKVFMPRGLCWDLPSDVLAPDYSKSAEEVFMDIAVFCMTRSGPHTLGIWRTLSLVAHPATGLPLLTPTWAPNWEQPLGDSSGSLPCWYKASNQMKDPRPKLDGKFLTTYGTYVDTLAFRAYTSRPAHPRELRHYEPGDKVGTYAATGETMREAFLRTIVGNWAGEFVGDKMQPGEAKMDWTIYDKSCIKPGEMTKRRNLRGAAQTLSANRAFGTTAKHGYMGMFPAACRLGDIVVVLAGGSSAYLLRSGGRQSMYAFVGECYVHGIMNGEAMGNAKDLERFVLE